MRPQAPRTVTAPAARRATLPQVLRSALAGGRNVALTPGGVQECFHMSGDPHQEVVFLRSRTGFVR